MLSDDVSFSLLLLRGGTGQVLRGFNLMGNSKCSCSFYWAFYLKINKDGSDVEMLLDHLCMSSWGALEILKVLVPVPLGAL